ncbi:MAG TPA: thioredoxin domain-containing protein [Burkholderiales bacterium]|nr:thioredoxin domain-containing protein [Burkholderiales bacterium]
MDFLEVSDDSLQQTIAKAGQPPLLVAFGNAQCGLCSDVKVTLLSLAEQAFKDKLRLASMDVDDSPKSVEEFGILSVPNLVLFKGSADQRSGWIGPWAAGKLKKFLQKQLQTSAKSGPISPNAYP